MKNIKIIRPYSKRPNAMNTLEGSLYKEGLTRAPLTSISVFPKQDAKGNIVTGLDENSIAIRSIIDEDAKKVEQARVRKLREDLEVALNEDLSQASAYWQKKMEEPYNFKDGDNVFDLNNPEQAIDYYWLIQTPIVAKSLGDIQSGKVDAEYIKFYVYEADLERENEFNRKKKINDVVSVLNKLDEVATRKVAFILNLKMPDKASYHEIYTQLDEFIKTPKTYGSHDPIDEFRRATSLTPEVLAIKVLIKKLLEERILHAKGSAIFEGQNLVSKSQEDLEIKLAEDQDMFMSYEAKSKSKKEYIDNI